MRSEKGSSVSATTVTLGTPWRLPVPGLRLRGTLRARTAVRVRVRLGDGGLATGDATASGVGEALPLPGFSPDDADTVQRVLAALAGTRLALAPGAPGAAQIAATLAPLAGALAPSPGARFALECALLDALSRRAGSPAAVWLAPGRALQPVAVSVLLPDDEAAAVSAAEQAVRRGHRVLKLKVGRADCTPAQEDALLQRLREACDAVAPGQVRFRLDANGALDAATLPQRLAGWAALGAEVVEEPLAGDALGALPALPLPWAADESLACPQRRAVLLALPRDRGPAALVLKPALLGLAACVELADAAARRGLGLIVTHSLDGDIGLAAAGALAQALPVPPWPCGLAPHAGLQRPGPCVPWLPVPTEPGLGVEDADA